jgi:hypothetical protein
MALLISRAKRTIGAFVFSLLMYVFPSLSGGCNVADLKDGGAESSDVQEGEDAQVAQDAGTADYGNQCGAYGPPPCGSDADCEAYGDGWYCDTDNVASFCGGEPQAYPVCKQTNVNDAGPADVAYEDWGNQCAAYGPKPCDTDQECATAYGAGWYCDKDHPAGYCNGQPVTWPTCIEGAPQDGGYADFGNPCAAYGPQPAPCQTDQECATTYGAGWYCDKDHQVDNCGTPATVPTCVPGGDQ